MFLKDTVLPKHIDNFIINKDKVHKIKKLFSEDFLSNLYIYGPAGCGKYTLFIKNLENIVGKEISIFTKTVSINSQWSTVKEIKILSSEFHFEVNLSKYSNNKNNLFSIIDAITESAEINNKLQYKLILVRNIQNASVDLVKFIKQKSEQLSDYVRFIIIGSTNSNNLSILRGAFFCIRISKPTLKEIDAVISSVTKKKLKKPQLHKIISESDMNLSKCFTKVDMILLSNFYKTRLELISDQICKALFDKKFSSLYEIRELIYEFQTSNDDICELLKKVLSNIIKSRKISSEKTIKLISIMCDLDVKQKISYKEVIHIEFGLFKIFKLIHS